MTEGKHGSNIVFLNNTLLKTTSCWHRSSRSPSSTRLSSPLTWIMTCWLLPFALWTSGLRNIFATWSMCRNFLEICICKASCGIFQSLQGACHRIVGSACVRLSVLNQRKKEVKRTVRPQKINHTPKDTTKKHGSVLTFKNMHKKPGPTQLYL